MESVRSLTIARYAEPASVPDPQPEPAIDSALPAESA